MEIYQIPASYPLREVRHFPRNYMSTFLPISAISSHSKTDKIELESRNRMFILGMGFIGQFFAQNLKNEGWVVTGTSTSTIKKEQLQERGFDICLFDANEPQFSTLNRLKHYTHLLVSIPSVVGIGDPVLQHRELLRSSLMDGNLQWLGYLSSTSVYGDCGGAWVDENYPPNPTSEVAKSRLAAEEGWLNLGITLELSTQVFRLGGIYGPGRSAVDTITKQEPISKSQKMRISKQYTSRVHVEDICQALKASIYKPSFGRIYNIVDDDPAPREEVFAYAEDLVGRKWPGWVKESTSSEKALSYNKRGEKRVSNGRLKRELGVRLLYPSYRSGLLSIIDQMENPL
ncbi:NAD dependent epimerase/dehydratase, putative [Ricinus communis]|uniref:NAD dependent epimerase/dehydratase, putative n=1 Tax=Ricinus communis TaxID=3988 RepID=B9R7Z5_RICCO|nr:NAD dependent epimerase/dehydratase, putative [Ricinus communis]|eukprot:XP_002510438.1 uncharacterized protein LOC8270003 [Ricinus communis]